MNSNAISSHKPPREMPSSKSKVMENLAPELMVMICEHADRKTLARLLRTSKKWYEPAITVLYQKDIGMEKDKQSKVLVKLVDKGTMHSFEDQRKAARVAYERAFDLGASVSVKFITGPNRYTTPLVRAVTANNSHRSVLWINMLLDKGVRTSSKAKGVPRSQLARLPLWLRQPQGRHIPTNCALLQNLRKEFLDKAEYFTPLSFSLFSFDRGVAVLLINKGKADGRIAWPRFEGAASETAPDSDSEADEDDASDGVNIGQAHAPSATSTPLTCIHSISYTGADVMGLMPLMLKRFPHLVNEQFPSSVYSGTTALHIAILSLNEEVFEPLVLAGADVDTAMGPLRKSPLNLAISQMMGETNTNRKVLKDFIVILLANGAGVNIPSPVGQGFPPLMTLLDVMKSTAEWTTVMKQTADILLAAGADVNYIAPNACTPLNILLNIIMSGVSNQKLKAASRRFYAQIVEREVDPANPNLDLGLGAFEISILQRAYQRQKDGKENCIELLKFLYKHGARFNNTEARAHFPDWAPGSCLRDFYDMGYHARNLELPMHRDLVDRAFIRPFHKEKPLKELNFLAERFKEPKDASALVYMGFEVNTYELAALKYLLTMNFRGSYVHPKSKICMVARLARLVCFEPKYTQRLAMDHLQILFDHGASVLRLDSKGLTPHQFIKRHHPENKDLDTLRLMLQDQKDVQRGED